MTSLFLHPDGTLSLEKSAAPVKRLSESPEQQDSEIYAELVSKNPFLGSYKVDLHKKAADQERGYLFGHFAVTIPRAVPPQTMVGMSEVVNPSLQQEEMLGQPIAKIPVIVKNLMLYPLDLLITPDAEVLPLTEERLSSVMQQYQTHETGPKGMTDSYGSYGASPNEVGPPTRSGTAGMAGLEGGIEYTKTSSTNMLDLALTTVTPQLKTAFVDHFREDVELQGAYESLPAFRGAVDRIANAEPQSAEKLAKAVMDGLPADVVQFSAIGNTTRNGVMVKSALGRAYMEHEQKIPPEDLDLLDASLIHEILKEGSVTMVINQAPSAFPNFGPTPEQPDCPDSYGVITKSAHPLQGVVIPGTVRMDGSQLDVPLFIGGDLKSYAFQEKMAALKIDPGPDLVADLYEACIGSAPRGYGVFVKVADSQAVATQPLHAGNRVIEPDGACSYFFNTDDGLVGKFAFVPGLLKVAHADEDLYLVPDDWAWVPLGKREKLYEEADTVEKAASAELYPKVVEVRCSGSDFSISGHPVDKLPQEKRANLSADDVQFVLGAAGVDTAISDAVITRSKKEGIAKIAVAKTLTPYGEVFEQVHNQQAPFVEDLNSLRSGLLLKEAAAVSLADPESVDTVLSLGFITADNLMGFIENKEFFEDAIRRVAELLLASRMGDLPDLPESAISRALTALEKAVTGLNMLEARLGSSSLEQ